MIGKFDPLRAGEVPCTSLRLGLTSFGGPIAHVGHFERVYVRERRWLAGEQFGGLVAQAVIVMAKRSCTAPTGVSLAVAAAGVALALGGTVAQLGSIALGAVVGALLCRPGSTTSMPEVARSSPRVAWVAHGLFVALLVGLWLAAQRYPQGVAALAEVFYRSGALVFGGGHVVLPLLHDALVNPGALAGVNAVVVGLLAAALVDPVWITAVRGVPDAAIAVAGLLMPHRWNVAPLAVLAWCVGASMAATLMAWYVARFAVQPPSVPAPVYVTADHGRRTLSVILAAPARAGNRARH